MLLPLHGAAAAEHVGDPEGDLVGAVRALMGSGALVVTDRDPQRAAQLATGLQVEGTVLLMETADCCGGDAASDSAASLNALPAPPWCRWWTRRPPAPATKSAP